MTARYSGPPRNEEETRQAVEGLHSCNLRFSASSTEARVGSRGRAGRPIVASCQPHPPARPPRKTPIIPRTYGTGFSQAAYPALGVQAGEGERERASGRGWAGEPERERPRGQAGEPKRQAPEPQGESPQRLRAPGSALLLAALHAPGTGHRGKPSAHLTPRQGPRTG